MPKGWRFANDDMLFASKDATKRRRFHNDNGKLIYLEHGLSPFGERFEPYIIPSYRRAGYLNKGMDTAGWFFSDDARLSQMLKES